jgi:carbamate kinase
VPPPLDVLVAESQGQIGYLLAQALTAQLTLDGRPRPVVPILTQTVVDPEDPAFAAPSKPVGPMYDDALARALGSEHGWTIARDGNGWRRVVPSPRPLEVVEATSVRALVAAGVIIASGGGGIPVSRVADGVYVGVGAVVDKDLAAVVLAQAVDADALLLLTDVDAVHLGWLSAGRVPIRRLTLAGAADGVADGTFAAGSMGPKVTAAAEFVQRTGRFAAIGALDEAPAVLEGRPARNWSARSKGGRDRDEDRTEATLGSGGSLRSPRRFDAVDGPAGRGRGRTHLTRSSSSVTSLKPASRRPLTTRGSASKVWYPPRCMRTIEPPCARSRTLATICSAVGPGGSFLTGRQSIVSMSQVIV